MHRLASPRNLSLLFRHHCAHICAHTRICTFLHFRFLLLLLKVCRTCALWCHVRHGHVLKGRPASGHYASRQLCECSLTAACHLLVSVSEGVPPHHHAAAVQAQRAVRQWLATRELKRRQQAKWQLRHHVATRTWQAAVTDPIWRVVTEATTSRQLAYERASMAVCDGESAAARKYLKLQVLSVFLLSTCPLYT